MRPKGPPKRLPKKPTQKGSQKVPQMSSHKVPQKGFQKGPPKKPSEGPPKDSKQASKRATKRETNRAYPTGLTQKGPQRRRLPGEPPGGPQEGFKRSLQARSFGATQQRRIKDTWSHFIISRSQRTRTLENQRLRSYELHIFYASTKAVFAAWWHPHNGKWK